MNSSGKTPKWERLWLAWFFGFTLIATAVVVYYLWAFARFQERAVARAFGSIPNPMITQWVYTYRLGFLLFPIPWLGFALYSLTRGAASVRQLLSYSSTLLFALVMLSMFSVIAFSLPWFSFLHGRPPGLMDTEELAQTLYAAERNDARANYALFRHYVYATRQIDLADYYLTRAAKLGHAGAKKDLERRKSVEKKPGQ